MKSSTIAIVLVILVIVLVVGITVPVVLMNKDKNKQESVLSPTIDTTNKTSDAVDDSSSKNTDQSSKSSQSSQSSESSTSKTADADAADADAADAADADAENDDFRKIYYNDEIRIAYYDQDGQKFYIGDAEIKETCSSGESVVRVYKLVKDEADSTIFEIVQRNPGSSPYTDAIPLQLKNGLFALKNTQTNKYFNIEQPPKCLSDINLNEMPNQYFNTDTSDIQTSFYASDKDFLNMDSPILIDSVIYLRYQNTGIMDGCCMSRHSNYNDNLINRDLIDWTKYCASAQNLPPDHFSIELAF